MNQPELSTSITSEAALVSQYQSWQMRRVRRAGAVIAWIVAVLLVVVAGRVVQLKLAPEVRLLAAAGSAMSTQTEMGRRGEIHDRTGRIIAASTVGYRLFVDPTLVADSSTIAVDLAHIVGCDPIEIDRKIIERSDKRYVVIEQQLEDWQIAAIRQAKLKGVALEPRLVRHYPFADIGASVVGLVGFEHTGLGAVEHQYDKLLEPVSGRLAYLRDAGRRALWIEENDYIPSEHGSTLTLTIDMVIQDIAERRLEKAVKEFNAGGGRIVVFDPRNGDVLAMHDVLRSRGWSEEISDPARKIHRSLGRNRCVTDPYEPGSTFKPFTWAAATELGKAKPSEVLPTPHNGEVHYTSYGRRIRDTFYYGPSTWHNVLVKSLNSGMSIVAERLTHKEMRGAITLYGFGLKTGCGLPGESAGILTSAKDWSKYTQTSVSFGQEIAVTALQMVRAFSVFARDGTLPPVQIVRRGNHDHVQPHGGRTVISPETVRLARLAMRDVLNSNAARPLQSQKYDLFGKSGTAQLQRKDGKGYHENRYVSSFIAGAPFDNPRLVVLCVIDDPDRERGHYGSTVAGPAVRDVMEQSLEYLGVPAKRVLAEEGPMTIARSD
jgi:cell division protein FtsI (penicillin-binding protein 3)